MEDRAETANSGASSDCESDSSFHSLAEEVQNLKVGENDFIDPGFETREDQCRTEDDRSSEENDDSEENNHTKDLYYIDKERLESLEKDLSPEDRENNHKEALEKKECGNQNFRDQLYELASQEYTSGLRICPLSYSKTRAILYANRAAARSKLDPPDLKACVEDCKEALENDPSYMKALLRRASYNRKLDNLDESLADYKKVLEIDPSVLEAREAAFTLPPLIEERNEKLKTEMLGKLKDLGNLVLKPFGLSTNNFEVNQDPNSGGYNIQFKQSGS